MVSTYVYKELWNPRLNENLDTMHEEIHAGWLFASYDYLTGAEESKCILKGWEKAGVTEISLFTVPLFLRGITLPGVAAILVCKSERDLGRVSELPRGAGVGVIESGRGSEKIPAPLGRQSPQITLAQDGGSSIEAYQSRESHGKIREL